MSVFPSKPSSAPWRHSAAKASRSRKSFDTPSRMSRPPARAASTICISQGNRLARPGPGLRPVSLTRSLVPATRQDSRAKGFRASAARLANSSMPRGVSIIAQRDSPSGASVCSSASSAMRMSSGPSTLGSRMASGMAPRAARKSSVPHSPASRLMRTIHSRPERSTCDMKARMRSRASSLAAGATASSRSTMTASQASVAALAIALALLAGT